MQWYEQLYVGEKIGKKADKIRWKIEHNAGTFQVYLLTLSVHPDSLIDIIPAVELMQKGYPRRELYVIGMKRGREDAMELAARIVSEVYHKTGAFDVRDYLLNQKEAETI